MKPHILFLLCVGLWCGGIEPELFRPAPDGSFQWENLKFHLNHWTKEWNGSSQSMESVRPLRRNGSWEWNGTFRTQNGMFQLSEKVTKTAPDTYSYRADLKGDIPGKTALRVLLPIRDFLEKPLLADGRKIGFFSPKTEPAIKLRQVRTLTIPLSEGNLVLAGNFDLQLQDNRRFDAEVWELRIFPRKEKNVSSFRITMRFVPFREVPISLAPVANMGFADETAGDRRGGWTDQGPDNDLSMCPLGSRNMGGVRFEICDPAGNHGKGCVVLAGKERPYFPEQAEVRLEKPVAAKSLYLLHALAWEPAISSEIGEITVEYTDNEYVEKSETVHSVRSGFDVGNFWNPVSLKNAVVGWKHDNPSASVGLYVTRLELSGKPVRKITFRSFCNPVWMIVGATFSDRPAAKGAAGPVVMRANADWAPVQAVRPVRKGSILDFSDWLDAPAGKYGFARASGEGRLFFEKKPEQPVRFYGTNLVLDTNFLSHADTDRMMDEIASTGYNMIRLHHFDRRLPLREKGVSTVPAPDRMDRMDYLVFSAKKRGIYITLDLFMLRHLEKNELPEFSGKAVKSGEFKGLVMLCESAMKNFETWSANFLNHVNPYTGTAWKEEPAIVSFSLLNEDSVFFTTEKPGFVRDFFERHFEQWLRDSKQTADAAARPMLWRKFLSETYLRAFGRMRSFMKNLGMKPLMTDQNFMSNIETTRMRGNYDLTDNHFYWGHPSFVGKSWMPPVRVTAESSIPRCAGSLSPIFPTRIFGLPFSVTEWDYVNPNPFNVEGAFLVGAYASLQDWSILCRFAYSHHPKRVTANHPVELFDCAGDPLRSLSERAGAALFLRRDASPASGSYPVLISRESPRDPRESDEYSAVSARLGLISRTGSLLHGRNEKIPAQTGVRAYLAEKVPAGRTLSAVSTSGGTRKVLTEMLNSGLIGRAELDLDKGRYRSDTGELILTARDGTFQAVTPRSEAFVQPEGSKMTGRFASVKSLDTFSAVLLTSRDGKPLTESDRILLLHLTNIRNTGMKFGNSECSLVEDWGTLPLLVRKGRAEVTVNRSLRGFRLHALTVDGKRDGEIRMKHGSASASFCLNLVGKDGFHPAYELVREP